MMTGLGARVYERTSDLPADFSISSLPAMPYPSGVVLCPPDHFDVIDVKNPFMAGNAGSVDKAQAALQWETLRAGLAAFGLVCDQLTPLPGCEDMVFSANTAFFGLDAAAAKTCVPGRMTFDSRRAEVAPILAWCEENGYRIADIGDPDLRFEGSGDAIWHPGRHLIWGGYGHRTDPRIYPALAHAFEAPVFALRLADPTYYHLDTCFCPIDESTVLVHAPAIAPDGMELVQRAFSRVIDVGAQEAAQFACNAAAAFGKDVLVDRRAASTAQRLRELGYRVIEIDTGEFLKSGGSVYCMKNAYF